MWDAIFRRTRLDADELMDEAGADPRELEASLRFLANLNRTLGVARFIVRHVAKMVRGRARVLDIATGAGDIPAALAAWGRSAGVRVEVVGVDLHPVTVAFARRQVRRFREVEIFRCDALALPFADGAFDFVTCSLFLHHLHHFEEMARVMSEADRLSRRGFVVTDLLRNFRAFFWARLMTQFAHNRLVKYDGPASVRRALSLSEARALAGNVHTHFGHRWCMVKTKSL